MKLRGFMIFTYTNYKAYIQDFISQMPHNGRGQYRKLAEHLGVNSTAVSQIFNGPRDLTPEQGLKIASYLGLAQLETKYFINLIQKERAGTFELKNYFIEEEKKLLNESKSIKSRIHEHKEISENDKARFYSDWYYSAIRMASAIPKFESVDHIAEHFGLNRSVIQKAVTFLLETGLCVEKNGQLQVGPQSTHLTSDSPLINNHRRNWRIKGLEQINHRFEEDLFYSSPMSLSEEDFVLIREELVSVITKVLKKVQKSPEQKLACLNIDWFSF